MKVKSIESKVRSVAAFAEAGSDMCEPSDKKHADDLFEGANWLLANARLVAHAGDVLMALESLMEDYNQTYQQSTDHQYGKNPGTPAWRRASRLVKKLRATP